eukprot:jgi/Ulvmu1/9983/UM059_0032.1
MSQPRLIQGREYGERPQLQFHFPPHYAKWLALSEEMRGHMGCVNRIAWNEDGTQLASGSDDRQVILWNYPHRTSPPLRIDTMHDLNIFGVAFLPCTNSSHIVTSAFDRMVQLHRLDRSSMVPTAGRPRPDGRGAPPVATQAVRCHTTTYLNHSESVKDVAVEPGNPHCFWSAAQDGRVHQFDLRCPDVGEATSANMLIQAPSSDGYSGLRVEFKALDINNAKPWMMATACSDRFVRVYDRRKLTLRLPSAAQPSPPLLELCPLHLAMPGHKASAVYTTCARFSHHGDRLIATYHREQAYTFDVTKESAPPRMSYCSTRPRLDALEAAACHNDAGYSTTGQDPPLDAEAAEMRRAANEAVMEDRWDDALVLYGQLLGRVPWLAQTWAARAIVLLRRGWKGDALFALRDADTCAALSPNWPKAYETRIRCLRSLGQIHTAMAELSLLMEEFPEEADSGMLRTLRVKLEKELAAMAERQAQRQRPGSDIVPLVAQYSGLDQDPPYAKPGEPGTAAAQAATQSSSSAGAVPQDAPCRQFRAYVRSLHPIEDETTGVQENGCSISDEVFHRVCNGSDSPVRNGTHAQPGASMPGVGGDHAGHAAWGHEGTSDACAAGTSGNACGSAPERVTRWVRQALQQSWGAWLAGDESTAAWNMCRSGATEADAAFMDDMRRMSWHGDGPSQHAQHVASTRDHSDTAEGAWAAEVEPRSGPAPSGHSGAPREGFVSAALRRGEEERPMHAGNHGLSRRSHGMDTDPWFLRDRSSRPVGAVVDFDEISELHDSTGDDDLTTMLPVGRATETHGPELCSYIYGHRRWDVAAEEYEAPQACSRAATGQALEALAAAAMRTQQRFVGQCNVITDIKEAVFVGQEDAVVACGSDQGRVFLFDSMTGELLRVLWADREVANCVQCHPTLPVLATSGMEDVVKLWEVERDNDANQVGAGVAEVSRMVEESQQEMEASRVVLPNMREAQRLRDFVRHPEMLQLMGVTQVGIREDERGSSEVTCRQS